MLFNSVHTRGPDRQLICGDFELKILRMRGFSSRFSGKSLYISSSASGQLGFV